MFNCASRVMFSVAVFAESRSGKWCLHCSWVSAGGVLEEAPLFCSILFHAHFAEVFVEP